jgi:hemerythrin
MGFQWTEELSVNIEEIDEQHKRLVKMINDFNKAMKNGEGRAIVSKILTGMINYSKIHFSLEEKYMKEFDFPGYEQHKIEHDAFVSRTHHLMERYKTNPNVITLETNSYLVDWLNHHIRGTDKRYSAFLNSKGIR